MSPIDGRPLILIVDHDEDTCVLLMTYLARHGYATRAATSGADALAIVARAGHPAAARRRHARDGRLRRVRRPAQDPGGPPVAGLARHPWPCGDKAGAMSDFRTKPVLLDGRLAALTGR